MNKISKYLSDNLKKAKGSVLAIGLNDQKLLDDMEKNNDITYVELLSTNIGSDGSKKSWFTKKVTIKEFKKKYKKKKINYIVCDYHLIKDQLKHFIKNSVYINKEYLYLFGDKDEIDIDLITKRYSRYNTSIDIIENNKEVLIVINNSKAKNHFFKDIYYLIIDSLYNVLDLLGTFLAN
ncbi:MAG: hypothetical protein PHE54_00780 [Bacilli bacterium]|nr:hypothetical protein [Bacilli bacterium]